MKNCLLETFMGYCKFYKAATSQIYALQTTIRKQFEVHEVAIEQVVIY